PRTLRYHRREASANEGRFVESGQHNEEAAQPGMVRAKRSRWIPLPELDEESGLASRPVRWAARYWNLQYMVGVHALQRSLSRARRVCETRCVGGRRFSARVSRYVAGGAATASHRYAVPQPRQHGCG